jgi:GTP-binding protein
MADPESLPIVAIVGRQNVGKSSLFNRLAGERVAIVDARPGTTLDRIERKVSFDGRLATVVDTGGLGFGRDEPYGAAIARQVEYAVERALAIVFVADVTGGITEVEQAIARRLRKSGRPVLLVVNKVDHAGRQPDVEEFRRLGFGDPIPISVIQNRGVRELVEAVAARLPECDPAAAAAREPPRLAVLGKPNVGKSTLVNALCGEERVIASERPGTTRDSVDIEIRRGGRRLILVDTAGLRPRGRSGSAVEFFGQARARQSLARSDGVLFLLEAPRGPTSFERKLGAWIDESGKPVVLAVNKWDLVPRNKRNAEAYERDLRRAYSPLSFAPTRFLSARTGLGVWDVVDELVGLVEASRLRVTTGELNRAIRYALQGAPAPIRGTREGRLLYATQVAVAPPTLVLFVQNRDVFSPSYVRHVERSMRQVLPFAHVPMRLLLRESRRRKKA